MLWRDFLSDEFTCSKRLLGWLLILSGGMVAGAGLTLGLCTDFGFSVMLILGSGGVAVVLGLTLLPLGDSPA